MSSDCTFCRILSGELPSSLVYRDERVWAFMDICPVTTGHVLVIPVRHATYLADLDAEDGASMMRVAQRVAASLRQAGQAGDGGLRCEGVNLYLCDGEVAGQDVFHVHLHVIPRYRGDGFGLRLPRGYGYRPPRAELDRIAASLRATASEESA